MYKSERDAIDDMMKLYRDWLEDIAAGLFACGVPENQVRVQERQKTGNTILHSYVYVKGVQRYGFQAEYTEGLIQIYYESGAFHPALSACLARYGCGGKRLV